MVLRDKGFITKGVSVKETLSAHTCAATETLQQVFELADSVETLSSLRGRCATYADDATVFTNPDKHGISMVMDIMNLFGKVF